MDDKMYFFIKSLSELLASHDANISLSTGDDGLFNGIDAVVHDSDTYVIELGKYFNGAKLKEILDKPNSEE